MRTANGCDALAQGLTSAVEEHWVGLEQVDLVQDDDLGLVQQCRVEESELVANHGITANQLVDRLLKGRVDVLSVRTSGVFEELGAIEQVNEHPCTLDV